MFKQLISTSWFGSDTPYVKGTLEKVGEEISKFKIDISGLSEEEKKQLSEIIMKVDELSNGVSVVNCGVTVTSSDTVMEFIEGELTFLLKSVSMEKDKYFTQATVRPGGIVHFQVKEDLGNDWYGKFDIKVDILAIILLAIIMSFKGLSDELEEEPQKIITKQIMMN